MWLQAASRIWLVVVLLALVERCRGDGPQVGKAIAGPSTKNVDDFCTLTGVPARDPAEVERIYLRQRAQRCNLLIPSAGSSTPTVGKIRYVRCGSVTAFCTWRVDSAIIKITAANLDQGTEPNEVSYQYIHALDDSPKVEGVVGMILSKRLGGSGVILANVFPASSLIQLAWEALQGKVYDCIKKKLATHASLRYEFFYRTDISSRPYRISIAVDFTESDGARSSQCESLVQNFDN